MPRQLANAQRRRRQRRSQPRQVLEELPVLDCRILARRNMVPRDHSQRTYNLSLLIPAIQTLKLGPRAAELVLVDGQTQMIPIVWLRINGMCQSARPAFQCPGCGHNRFKLFYRHGRFSGCYRCIGVPYASQQCSTKNRPRLQAARLRLFLSSLPEDTQNPRQTRIDVQTHIRPLHRSTAQARSQFLPQAKAHHQEAQLPRLTPDHGL